MKLVTNPKWKEARYEIQLLGVDKHFNATPIPVRFNEIPPKEIWENDIKLRDYIKKHSVPARIMQREVSDDYPEIAWFGSWSRMCKTAHALDSTLQWTLCGQFREYWRKLPKQELMSAKKCPKCLRKL